MLRFQHSLQASLSAKSPPVRPPLPSHCGIALSHSSLLGSSEPPRMVHQGCSVALAKWTPRQDPSDGQTIHATRAAFPANNPRGSNQRAQLHLLCVVLYTAKQGPCICSMQDAYSKAVLEKKPQSQAIFPQWTDKHCHYWSSTRHAILKEMCITQRNTPGRVDGHSPPQSVQRQKSARLAANRRREPHVLTTYLGGVWLLVSRTNTAG